MLLPSELKLTKEVYEASTAVKTADSEIRRNLLSENFGWSDGKIPQPSPYWCLLTVSENFRRFKYPNPDFETDEQTLLQLLPTDLPLKDYLKIDDELFWKSQFERKWVGRKASNVNSWKNLYISTLLQEYLENQKVNVYNEEEAIEFTEMVAPYIRKLSLKKLRMARSNEEALTTEDDDSYNIIQDRCPYSQVQNLDHIPLQSVLQRLIHLEELDIVFGCDYRADNCQYNEKTLRFSRDDSISLAEGLKGSKTIEALRIIRCHLDCNHSRIILQRLLHVESLVEIDFSHCQVGDLGATALGGFLMKHNNLKILKLVNNPFSDEGFRGLAFGLQSGPVSPLDLLDLRLNVISELSASHLAAALVRSKEHPRKLNLSGCDLQGISATKIVEAVSLNQGLTDLYIHSNDLSGPVEEVFLSALDDNTTLLNIDFRNTGISECGGIQIEEILMRNRKIPELDRKDREELPPLYLDEPEYLVWDYNPNNPDHLPGFYPPRVPEP